MGKKFRTAGVKGPDETSFRCLQGVEKNRKEIDSPFPLAHYQGCWNVIGKRNSHLNFFKVSGVLEITSER